MRISGILILLTVFFISCDDNRVFERNYDFEEQHWLVSSKPEFEFTIPDSSLRYNLYCDVRNEESYPKANLYFTYYLSDSTGRELQKKLMSEFLFDKKTGEPFGSTALGDIYDHQIPILKNYSFKHLGKYKVKFEQFMRTDTLHGILAVGLRVEKAEIK